MTLTATDRVEDIRARRSDDPDIAFLLRMYDERLRVNVGLVEELRMARKVHPSTTEEKHPGGPEADASDPGDAPGRASRAPSWPGGGPF